MAAQNVDISIDGPHDHTSESASPIHVDIDEGYCDSEVGMHLTMEDLSRHFDQQSLHHRPRPFAIDASGSHAHYHTTPNIHRRPTPQNYFSTVRRQRQLASRNLCNPAHLRLVSHLVECMQQESSSSYQTNNSSSFNTGHGPYPSSEIPPSIPDTRMPTFADDWFCPYPSPFLSSPEDSESERSVHSRPDRQPVLFTRNMFDPPTSKRRNAVEKSVRMRKRGADKAHRHRTT